MYIGSGVRLGRVDVELSRDREKENTQSFPTTNKHNLFFYDINVNSVIGTHLSLAWIICARRVPK
jgi:hypothetical protein